MLNTHIYHHLPPTCFGVCYTIFRETIALLAPKPYAFCNVAYLLQNHMLFAVLLTCSKTICFFATLLTCSKTICFLQCCLLVPKPYVFLQRCLLAPKPYALCNVAYLLQNHMLFAMLLTCSKTICFLQCCCKMYNVPFFKICNVVAKFKAISTASFSTLKIFKLLLKFCNCTTSIFLS